MSGWPAAVAALPIAEVLGDICAAMRGAGHCVLQAPPGAGKTTGVPLALLQGGAIDGRIVMLEPRRVAARAAAARLAETLGQPLGQDIGYRMRGESVAGARLEVITEGILTRMIQSDPELSGIGAVIFDEFHERALQADLGLALCLEIRAALRADLKLMVMSATLDAAPVAALMGAPIITAEGRSFPVDIHWARTPLGAGAMTGPGLTRPVADLVSRAYGETEDGDILVFLPGQREIRAVEGLLDLPRAAIVPLYGGLPFKAQRAALGPDPQGRRKVVLSTAIAETSLTIPGVRVVVDAGRARRARLDPATGMSRLVTERVTRAEATQRAGRAGRVAPGRAYRLWTRGEEGALAAFPPPEIEIADLVPLALELAMWGAQAGDLPFLTPPPEAAMAAARDLLRDLGAMDVRGGLTEAGRALGAMPLHPRLGAMLRAGGPSALRLAGLLSLRAPLPGGADLGPFLAPRPEALTPPQRAELAAEEKRLRRFAGTGGHDAAELLALAYPDRIALRRPGDAPRYHLSGGTGARLDDADALAGQRMLVAADLDGDRTEARIRRALATSEAQMRALFQDRIERQDICRWSRRHRRIEALTQERLGALVLRSERWAGAGDAERIPALLEAVRDLGLSALSWSGAAQSLRGRAIWVRESGEAGVADLGDAALLASLEAWLAPWLSGLASLEDLRALDMVAVLRARLGPEGLAAMDRLAPATFTAPTGTSVRIDYSGAAPEAQIRLQEVFGLDRHPVLGAQKVPLLLTLLSPAGRPVQSTGDLPGFWRSSYADVRKDMRGRYPRHPWPEDPLSAAPTRRAKPRGT